ncbi:5419_t:CDS:1, partial [Acaulospora colombiana]
KTLPLTPGQKQKSMYSQRMLHIHNATFRPNYNEEALAKGPVSPKAKLKQITTEEKPNIMEKTARPVKENLTNLELTLFQMQQL